MLHIVFNIIFLLGFFSLCSSVFDLNINIFCDAEEAENKIKFATKFCMKTKEEEED